MIVQDIGFHYAYMNQEGIVDMIATMPEDNPENEKSYPEQTYVQISEHDTDIFGKRYVNGNFISVD